MVGCVFFILPIVTILLQYPAVTLNCSSFIQYYSEMPHGRHSVKQMETPGDTETERGQERNKPDAERERKRKCTKCGLKYKPSQTLKKIVISLRCVALTKQSR